MGKVSEVNPYNIKIKPRSSELYNKGYKLEHENKFDEAIVAYKNAIAVDPSNIDAYDNAGLCYRRIGNLDSAEHYYKLSIQLYPAGTVARQDIASLYTQEKKYDEATEEYNAIIKLEPKNPEGYYGLGQLLLEINKPKESLEPLNKADKLYAEAKNALQMDTQYMLGVAYLYMKDQEKAKSYINKSRQMGREIPPSLLDAVGLK